MMLTDWMQIFLLVISVVLLSPILGKYLAQVYTGSMQKSFPFLNKFEGVFYRLSGIDETVEMNWKEYLKALLIFNLMGFSLLFLILFFQGYLPLNPENLSSLSWDLSFNIAASFTTNTNWQSYSGENTLSYFSQMVGLTTQNFLSASTGIAAMLALVRGFKNKQQSFLGNFWVDLFRSIFYVFLPFSIALALLLVANGSCQTLKPYQKILTLENKSEIIPIGPVASQVAIKQIGGNGGGYFGVNSAHPYENPTALTNFFEHLFIVLIPAALIFTFGFLLNDQKQANMLFYLMILFWVGGLLIAGLSEGQYNPSLNVAKNLEGTETRFGPANSVFWTISTTATGNGSANSAIASQTPIVQGVALFNLITGGVIFGGVGVGICMLMKYLILSVFIAGVMVGRSPEYLGKKIEKKEILYVIISILGPAIIVLVSAGLTVYFNKTLDLLSEKGPHGFSEILYTFSTTASNNGSSMASFNTNTPFFNTLLGILILLGRLSTLLPALLIAGSVSNKIFYPTSKGTITTDTFLFGMLLGGIIVIVGCLSFFPTLILGPIFDQLVLSKGEIF